jgi:hypothetical protein
MTATGWTSVWREGGERGEPLTVGIREGLRLKRVESEVEGWALVGLSGNLQEVGCARRTP